MRTLQSLIIIKALLLVIATTTYAHEQSREKARLAHFDKKDPKYSEYSFSCNFGSNYPRAGCEPLDQHRCEFFGDFCSWNSLENSCDRLE